MSWEERLIQWLKISIAAVVAVRVLVELHAIRVALHG